ncbi:hypothetical protein KY315_04180, partial [Candidatus Woesearchaeota archaeon]|nr:hypothetical protein [Candidatus Woesearchaeota archaeon]
INTIIKEIKKDIIIIAKKGDKFNKGPKTKFNTGSRKLKNPIYTSASVVLIRFFIFIMNLP